MHKIYTSDRQQNIRHGPRVSFGFRTFTLLLLRREILLRLFHFSFLFSNIITTYASPRVGHGSLSAASEEYFFVISFDSWFLLFAVFIFDTLESRKLMNLWCVLDRFASWGSKAFQTRFHLKLSTRLKWRIFVLGSDSDERLKLFSHSDFFPNQVVTHFW